MRHILLALCLATPAAAQSPDAIWQSLMDGNRAFVQRIRDAAGKAASLEAAVRQNARASAAYLLANSKVIREAVDGKRVGLVVAFYHLDSGVVERLR